MHKYSYVNYVDLLYELLIYAAKTRMLTGSMFEYARFLDQKPFGLVGKASHGDVWDKIRGEARGILPGRSIFERVVREFTDRIERKKEGGYSPWLEKFDE